MRARCPDQPCLHMVACDGRLLTIEMDIVAKAKGSPNIRPIVKRRLGLSRRLNWPSILRSEGEPYPDIGGDYNAVESEEAQSPPQADKAWAGYSSVIGAL